MAEKKTKCLPHYGFDWFGGCEGADGYAFAPLYGPWAAISTGSEKEPEAGEASSAAYASGSTIPSGGPGGDAGGAGGGVAVESRLGKKLSEGTESKKVVESAARLGLKPLTEDLDYMAQVLGGFNPADLPGLFFDAPLVGDPDDEELLNPVDDGVGDDDDDGIDLDCELAGDESPQDVAAEASPFCAAITSLIHKKFTHAMDNLVIAGELDQSQRIDLSRCIGKALDAFTQELSTCDWSDSKQLSDASKTKLSESYHNRLTDAEMLSDAEQFLAIMNGQTNRKRKIAEAGMRFVGPNGPDDDDRKRLNSPQEVMAAIKGNHEWAKLAAEIKSLHAKWDGTPKGNRFRDQMYDAVGKLKNGVWSKYRVADHVWAGVNLVESAGMRFVGPNGPDDDDRKRLNTPQEVMAAIKANHEWVKLAAGIKDLHAKWDSALGTPKGNGFRDKMYDLVGQLKQGVWSQYRVSDHVWAGVNLVK